MQNGTERMQDGDGLIGHLARYWVPVVLLLALAVFVPALGIGTFYKEEGRRVAQALSILHGGSWWLLDTFGTPYFNKPPMLPWLIALGARLTGAADEVAARLPSLVAVIGGALAAGLLAGRAAAGRSAIAALFAGLFFLATYNIDIHAVRGTTDATATFFAALVFLIWALARRTGTIGLLAWAGITLALSAGLLTKGPIPLLFPLVPMIVVPLRERRYGEIVTLGICLAISAIPLVYWLVLNARLVSLDYIVTQMRIRRAGPPFSLLVAIGHVLRNVAEGLVRSLPVAAAGIAWAWQTKAWRFSSAGWLHHSLFLYGLAVTLFVLLWPQSGGRYALPAAWPLAVMSGLWGAWRWDRRSTRIVLAAVAAIFVVAQIAGLLTAGNSDRQIALRREAVALRQAFAGLAEGRVLLVADRDLFNRFGYTQRNIQLIEPVEMACAPEGRFLLAEDPWREKVDPASWTRLKDIGVSLSVYARQAGAPLCPDRVESAVPDGSQ